MLQDFRYALRSLRNNPGFTAVAVLALALGLGATTVVVSGVNALFLRDLPVSSPDRLYVVNEMRRGVTNTSMALPVHPYERYLALRDVAADALDGLAAFRYVPAFVRLNSEARTRSAIVASSNYFEVLGLRLAAGRFFDHGPGPGIVISYEVWQRELGGARDVVGRPLQVDGRMFEVAGVGPRGFDGTFIGLVGEFWIPADLYWRPTGGDARPRDLQVTMFGRLRAGATPRQSESALTALAQAMPGGGPAPAVTGVRLEPLNGLPRMARGPFIGFMGLLFATAGLVLCIAASNVAGMLLARATYRRGEMAVRLAVGAGRGRIIRQLLTETLALCAIGGAAGTVLAYWITTLVPAIQPPIGIRTAFDVSLDRRVLLVAAGITMLTGLLAGIAPAVHTTGRDPIATLRGTGVAPAVSSRARNLFVGAQLAMSLVLLVAAGLFVRALQRGLAVDPGLDATGVVMGSLNLGPRGYDATRTRLFVDQLLDRLNGRPEIAAAAVGQWGPLSGPYRSVGVPRPVQGGGETSLPVWYGTAGVGYLELLKVPVVTGRTFTAADRAETEPVLIVNQTMARALWPGGSAVGETIYLAGARRVVVGVVRDGRYRSLDEAPMAFAFLPYAQYAGTEVTVYARARGAVEDALLALRREVAALDPDVALEQPRSLASQIAFLLLPQRIAAGFIGAFGLVGLLLAAIGVYGVLAFHVAQRTREFGLRLALGATPGDLIRQVLRQGSGIMLAGGAAGLVLALAVGWLARSFLFGVPAADPATLLAGSLVLAGAALGASYIPARRVTRVDPMAALRYE